MRQGSLGSVDHKMNQERRLSQMGLEDEVQGKQDQAQKIIEMPQRDQQAPRSENP